MSIYLPLLVSRIVALHERRRCATLKPSSFEGLGSEGINLDGQAQIRILLILLQMYLVEAE